MLILTEKKSVAKDFATALDAEEHPGFFINREKNIEVVFCQGHLFELVEPEFYNPDLKKWDLKDLPIIPNEFKYQRITAAAYQTQIVLKKLKEHNSDKILIATDADREGELIGRIILDQAKISNIDNCYRFWVSESLVPHVILSGIKNAKPLSEYNKLAQQGYARQRADWLVGINLSRFISIGNSEIFPVGRVQTAVLCEIAKRNYEVKNFIPEKYSECEAKITDSNGTTIKAKLIDAKNKTAFSPSDYYLNNAKKCLINMPIEKNKSSSEKKTIKPPKLLNLNTLSKIAFKKYSYTPEKTLQIAEELYNDLKCLSYPRTPSRVLGENNVELFLEKFELLKENYPHSKFCNSKLINSDNKNIFDSKKLESHHALIPLALLPEKATVEQKNIFNIVLDSFFTVCQDDYIYNIETVLLFCGNYILKTGFKQVVQSGWMGVGNENIQNEPANDGFEVIQEITKFNKENCHISEIVILDKKTKPKREYSIDTLLDFMEKPKGDNAGILHGLGTSATRPEIIKKLFSSGYVLEENKKLFATKKGIWLLNLLAKNNELAKIANVNQTTIWENELNTNPLVFENHIIDYVSNCIKPEIKEIYTKESPGICPVCGKSVMENKISFNCSGWTENCKFTIWKKSYGTNFDFEDAKNLLSGNYTAYKNCKNKAGKKFKAKFKLHGSEICYLVYFLFLV